MHKTDQPPRLAEWLVRKMFPDGGSYSTAGDLAEAYRSLTDVEGIRQARRWYWGQVSRALPNYIASQSYWRWKMLVHYVKIGWRNLYKHKLFSVINVVGLSLGIACTIVIFKFVIGEIGYDTYHPHRYRLYRMTVTSEILSTGERRTGALSSLLWAPAMQRLYPEIEKTARLVYSWEPRLLEVGESRIAQDNVYFAETSVFDLFGWRLIVAEGGNIFEDPYAIVLSERCARKYFGDENPLGKTLFLIQQERGRDGRIQESRIPMTVKGLMEDVPAKTHVNPEVLISFVSLNQVYGGDVNAGSHPNPNFWRYTIGYTYLRLAETADPAVLERKFPRFLEQHIGDMNTSRGFRYHLYLQNVAGIHLEKNVHSKPEAGTDEAHLYLFSVIAFFVLLIACFNFINLSTARSASRAQEVGIRKVVGSSRKRLITQFLGESFLISVLAVILGFILSEWAAPVFSHYTGKDIHLLPQDLPLFIVGLGTLLLLVAVLAGGYPAFVLSGFRPVHVFRKTLPSGMKGVNIRKALVVLQFAITVFFIIGALTVRRQVAFMRTQNLGFNGSQVLVVSPMSNAPNYSQLETFRNELLRRPNIEGVCLSSVVPGRMYWQDLWARIGDPDQKTTVLTEIQTDFDFIDLYGLEVIAGRPFLREMGTDRDREFAEFMDRGGGRLPIGKDGTQLETGLKRMAIILNETAVRNMGLGSPEEALGKSLVRDPVSVDFYGTVIGVVRDFHFETLKTEVQPLVLFMIDPTSQDPGMVSIRLSGQDMLQAMDAVEKAWKTHFPESINEIFFVDENFGRLYEQEEKIYQVYGYVSFLSIFIASLGLFGLVLYMVEQKTKEIGIRKVLGASIPDIFFVFSRDHIKLVFFANVIAWPVSYYVMKRWLEDFAYRTRIDPWTFLMTAVAVTIVVWLTIGFHILRAARTNPVDSLRYE